MISDVTYNLLVVDDDERIRNLLSQYLINQGFIVSTASGSEEARNKIKLMRFDLIVLDIMMPGDDGLILTREIRSNSQTPIILLTAKSGTESKIEGLELGADDYLTKPFSFPELMARIKALLRRSNANDADEINVGDISVNLREYKVTRSGKEIDIGPTEFKLLNCFIKQPRRVFSREQLLDHVWGVDNINVEIRTVDVHIGRLRKALSIKGTKDPIRTVRSAGYSLEN